MTEKRLASLNAISIPIVIFVNYYTQAIQLNGNTMQSLSEKYYNLFTPAPYAFSIWGIIYLALIGLVCFQVYQAFGPRKNLRFIQKTGMWLFLANILNSLWVVIWLYELTGISVLVMIGLLFCLLKIVQNNNMERWDAPFRIIAFNWWPICLYSGWVTVALITNIAAYLVKIDWNGFGLSPVVWTLIMMGVTVIINLLMVAYRNMREYAAVAMWALAAIAIRHFDNHYVLALGAIGCIIILVLYTGYHGFINRKKNPLFKMLQSR